MIRMGRSTKPEQPETPNYQPTTPAPAQSYQYATNETPTASSRVVTDSESIARDIKEGRLSGFVGHGTELTGETNFQMMLRVDGHLTGTVTSDGGTLIVGTNGQVDANVSVAIATVNGAVNGDIIASDKIQLGRTAHVIGNITTPKLVIEDGAVFEGGCTMLQARESQQRAAGEAQSQSQQANTVETTSSNQENGAYDDESSSYTSSSDSDDDDADASDDKADAAVI